MSQQNPRSHRIINDINVIVPIHIQYHSFSQHPQSRNWVWRRFVSKIMNELNCVFIMHSLSSLFLIRIRYLIQISLIHIHSAFRALIWWCVWIVTWCCVWHHTCSLRPQITVVGHSLGASMACLCAFDLVQSLCEGQGCFQLSHLLLNSPSTPCAASTASTRGRFNSPFGELVNSSDNECIGWRPNFRVEVGTIRHHVFTSHSPLL